MFFNYDSFELFAVAFVVSGIFICSFYNSSTAGPINNESLINTNSSLDSLSKLDSNIHNLPTASHNYADASIQTLNIQVEAGVQSANTYVNTGMQTSPRMWLESVKIWINDILGGTPNPNPQYIDVGVQTNAPSLWGTVKQWFLEVCSIRGSDLTSMGYNKVTKWRNKLDSTQSVDLHDSESPLTNIGFETESTLQQLVAPDDSASNISEVISLSNLQEVVSVSNVRIYDMNNAADVLDLMNDPTVVCFNSAVEGNLDDELLTFCTADSTYDILRSTLEALLTSVN